MISTTKKIKKVAFFGDADLNKDDPSCLAAEKIAELLAINDYTIVNGGGPGIMLAATKGAKKGGGKVELVVMNPKNNPNNYEGINPENLKLADKVIETKSYPERLDKLIEIADAFIVFNGGTGTLSEVGMVWEQAKFDYGKHEPIIFFGQQWRKVVEDLQKGMNYENKEKDVVIVVEEVDEVLKVLRQVGN